MKKNKALGLFAKCIALGLSAGIILGAAVPFTTGYVIPNIEKKISANANNDKEEKTEEKTDNGAVDVAAVANLDEASKNTVELIKKVKPSVVCITTKTTSMAWYSVYESEGAGSGVIFHEDDDNVYIVTNAHVVSGASQVMISVEESDLVNAELVGKDTEADLAVISVSKDDLAKVGIKSVTVADFGGSDDLRMGESVIAIGNALGQGNTATAGIVSAVSKNVNIKGKKLTVVQTDAAINPGNSGGALINSKGQVIGINTAKLAIVEVEGIGYAIASDVAKPIVESLMNRSDTPALGVYVTDISEETAAQYGLPQAGVMIDSIMEGGSADKAGLQEGDIVTAYNESPIFTAQQLVETIKNSKVGETVKITIIRDGETKTVNVKLYKAANEF